LHGDFSQHPCFHSGHNKDGKFCRYEEIGKIGRLAVLVLNNGQLIRDSILKVIE
jgi:hypothetical protein